MVKPFLTAILCAIALFLGGAGAKSLAQSAAQSPASLESVLADNFNKIKRSSVKTIDPVLEALLATNHPLLPVFLENWKAKKLWYHKKDKRLIYAVRQSDETYALTDSVSGAALGTSAKSAIKQIKPNSGVRAKIASALVGFQLLSPDASERRKALAILERRPAASHLPVLREAAKREQNADLKAQFTKLERLLTISFDSDKSARIAAMRSLAGALSLDARATLNPLLTTKIEFSETVPENANIARIIRPGASVLQADGTARAFGYMDWLRGNAVELTNAQAYALLVEAGVAPEIVSQNARNETLIAHIVDGHSGGFSIDALNTEANRDAAYRALAKQGLAPIAPSAEDITNTIARYIFYARYIEPDSAITAAAQETLARINSAVWLNGLFDLALDAISLASIYFLAAIGLAITFGVMRVINMAHGEFIMMGAYSGYVVQLIIPDYTLSIIVAIPVAFCTTFLSGVLLERLVIRHLYDRPLETLLATFGVSIALQQIAKNIFGTQARPLTAPDWLDGSLVINDVVAISWIRVVIFVLSIMFFIGLWWILNKTRLGLETRAVTQNPRMAAAMGINPDRINMLTFGLGSGIAGIAGVAIGLYAKVTSELGSEYIVQSFMTVVVGGVGNIWGTLAGAGLIGILQKLIETANPSNTLAAQTYMIIFIIIFIQFRPRGIFALKGRSAEA